MKQVYEKAVAETVLFNNSDIVTTSGGTVSSETNSDGCDKWWNNMDYWEECTGILNGSDWGGGGNCKNSYNMYY